MNTLTSKVIPVQCPSCGFTDSRPVYQNGAVTECRECAAQFTVPVTQFIPQATAASESALRLLALEKAIARHTLESRVFAYLGFGAAVISVGAGVMAVGLAGLFFSLSFYSFLLTQFLHIRAALARLDK